MTWIRLTTYWIVSECELGKVSICTSGKNCVGLHMLVGGCVCAWNFGTNFFLGGENVNPEKILIF